MQISYEYLQALITIMRLTSFFLYMRTISYISWVSIGKITYIAIKKMMNMGTKLLIFGACVPLNYSVRASDECRSKTHIHLVCHQNTIWVGVLSNICPGTCQLQTSHFKHMSNFGHMSIVWHVYIEGYGGSEKHWIFMNLYKPIYFAVSTWNSYLKLTWHAT